MSIAGLERRLSILELPTGDGIDPLEQPKEKCCTDNELGVLEEFMGLVHSGYS